MSLKLAAFGSDPIVLQVPFRRKTPCHLDNVLAAKNAKVAKKELRGTPYDILSNHAVLQSKSQPSKGSIPAIS